MQYLSAYLLAQLGGAEKPTVAQVKAIFTAAGAEFDQVKAQSISDALNGKDVDSLISQGRTLLSSVPSSSAAPAAAAAIPSATAKPAQEKAKPKKEESEVEDVGFDLFG